MSSERRSGADERTALSWERSGLALAIVAALLVSASYRGPWLGIPAAALLGVAAVTFATRGRQLAHRRASDAVPVRPEWSAAGALTAVTLLAVVLAAALLVI
jgi:hypothetical protein